MLSLAGGSAAPGTPRPHRLLLNASLLRCVRYTYFAGMVSLLPDSSESRENHTLTSEGQPVDIES